MARIRKTRIRSSGDFLGVLFYVLAAVIAWFGVVAFVVIAVTSQDSFGHKVLMIGIAAILVALGALSTYGARAA